MVYQWKTGSRHKVPASIAGEEIRRLSDEGRLNAKALVDESRDEDAPLHPEFEWDDSVAAEKWREEQASAIIRHCIMIEERTQQPVRAFFLVNKAAMNYEPIELILADVDKTAMLLDQAKKELKAFKAKYGCLTELAGIFKEIRKLTEGDEENE